MFSSINFAMRHLPKIIQLLKQDSTRIIESRKAEDFDVVSAKHLLSVIVVEEEGRFSNPQRLIRLLDSVSQLYEACAILSEASPDSLSVVALDSGSDKSFDFLGLAKVVDSVKEVILTMWDRVVFYREKKLIQRLELVAQALPIIDQIGALESAERLEREQAEILRRKVINGISGFMESGAMLPEFEQHSSFNPRYLMAPEPKLLAGLVGDEPLPSDICAPIDDARSEGRVQREAASDPLAELTADEKQRLLEMLRREPRGGQTSIEKPEDEPDRNSE